MIAEALAGKRIAVTGSTGFLGTAVVERLLRAVPSASSSCSCGSASGPARPSGSSEISATTPSTGSRRPRQGRLQRDRRPPGAGDRRRRRHRRPRPRRRRPGHPRQLRHRDPLGRHGVVRLAARRRGRGQPARAHPHRRTLNDLGRAPHLVAVSTCYVAGNRRGSAPESVCRRARSTSASTGGQEVAAARRAASRRRGREPQPERLARSARRPATSWGAGAPALAAKTEQRREPGWRPHGGAGRARAASLGWPDACATRPSASRPSSRRRATCRSRSCARRSSSRRWPPRPGWIRGFRMAEPVIISYARGPAEGVPRRRRGDRRRDPGRPRGRRMVPSRPGRGPERTARPASRRWLPARPTRSVRAPGRERAGLVRGAPALRQPGPTHRGEWGFPGGAGWSASSAGPSRCSAGPTASPRAAPARRAGDVVEPGSRRSRERPTGR